MKLRVQVRLLSLPSLLLLEFFILQEPLFVRFISYLALKSFTFFTVDQPLVRLSSPTTILSFSFAIYPTTTC